MGRPKLTDDIILEMMKDSCPAELCNKYCEKFCKNIDCADDCDKIQLEEFKQAIYQQGRADLLKSIRECAKHLGYDDIEDLLSYVNKKEQSNADTTQ